MKGFNILLRQIRSPYWSYCQDKSTNTARWFLKDFGVASLGLCLRDEVLHVYCSKNWSIAQEEFAGHYAMHAWCKRFKIDINDDRYQGFTVYFDEKPSNLDKEVVACVSSITEDIELTLLFYQINEKIKQLNHA
jgi:hypothetical protein